MKTFNLTERYELTFWCGWRDLGLGVTSVLNGGLWCVSLHLLFVGVALTRWPDPKVCE